MPHKSILTFARPALAFAAVAATAACVGLAAAQPAAPSPVTDFVLANGLEVVVIPDRRAPIVTHMLWYKVGSADETPGKSGLAHFLEHLMFKGTGKHPTGFSQVVATIGGQENAFTSSDYTGYYQRVPREYLKDMMAFEADRMTGLVLTDDVVKPELKVVLEEWNMRVGNSPGARLGQQMDAMLYINHPYGRPVIGWHQEIEKLNREDALAFYRRFYTPNNAILVIAGDVTVDEVKKFIDETYAKVPRVTEIAPRVRPQVPAPEAPRTVTLADPRVTQPTVYRYYLVPSINTAQQGESEALEVLAHLLGWGSSSRLYQALVVDKGIAVSVGAGYGSTALDATRFSVYGTPKAPTSLPQVEAAIDAVLAEMIDKGVSGDELDRAKNRMIADAIYAHDNQRTLAQWYGGALASGSTIERVRSWPDRIRTVTADAVRDAARKWLDKRRSVTGYLVKDVRPEEKRS